MGGAPHPLGSVFEREAGVGRFIKCGHFLLNDPFSVVASMVRSLCIEFASSYYIFWRLLDQAVSIF
jgi:hypothetical protein